MSWTDRFPLLAEYLEGLPDGLESYPACRAKGTLLRSAIEGHEKEELLEGLPEPLQEYVRRPPPPGLWLPAVHSDAIFHAVCDRFYPEEDAMLEWCGRRTQTWARNPLYKAVLRVPGPRVLFTMATRSHALFQQGTDLSAENVTANSATLRMLFPERLHNRRNLMCNTALFAGLTELLGGKNTEVKMTRHDATSALYEASWG